MGCCVVASLYQCLSDAQSWTQIHFFSPMFFNLFDAVPHHTTASNHVSATGTNATHWTFGTTGFLFCSTNSKMTVRTFELTCFPTVCRAECCLYAAQTRYRTTVPGRGHSRDSRQSHRLQPSCLPAHPPPGRINTLSKRKQNARGSDSEF